MASTNDHHHRQSGTPAPPPPTPSNQTLPTAADAALSQFLHQLLIIPPKTLSSAPLFPRPSKRHPKSHPQPPLISLLHPQQELLLSAASDLGFFHVTDHRIPSYLPNSALLDSQSLLHSNPTTNRSALGFNHDDEDEEDNSGDALHVFDTGSGDLDALAALGEYSRSLERVGLEVVEMISSTGGFPENPFRVGTAMPARCLMFVSSSVIKEEEGEMMETMKGYPYVVCLQYEMERWRKPSWLLGDSGGWTAVAPRADSVLVTLGDLAQVWSNGRFKKVRGRPQLSSMPSDAGDDSEIISMSLLVTLPMDCVVSPLLPLTFNGCGAETIDGGDDDGDEDGRIRFREFSFEEYAWRVYHERLPFKDPLLRYRT